MSRCVIITAAPWPDDETLAAMKELLRPDDVVFAADNGWRLAAALGVAIDCLVGDFDSGECPEDEIAARVVTLPTIKDETDTFAAVQLAQREGYTDFLLLGGLGGRFDHTLANLATLQYIVKSGGTAAMADGVNEVYMTVPSTFTISPRKGYFSLLPYGGEVEAVSVSGAFYDVKGITLTTDVPLGVSNAFCGKEVTITYKRGNLLLVFSKD